MNAQERIQTELARRILASERTRAQILAWTSTAALPAVTAFIVLVSQHSGVHSVYFLIAALCAASAGYEWRAWWKLGKAIRDDQPPHRFYYYLNALVEIGIPFLIILLTASYTNPSNPINGPFSYFFFLLIILAPLRLDVRLCLFTGCLSAAAYALLLYLNWDGLAQAWVGLPHAMKFNYISRIILFAIGGIVAAFVTHRIRSTLFETFHNWAEQERIVGLFGQHVSPAVVNQLLSQSDDFSELRSVCVLVFDIRNFTTFSEHRTADEVVDYLNTLWSYCVGCVNRHEGIVNKFLGDGFLAVFGAPVELENNAKNALAAGHELIRQIDQLVAEKKLPPTNFGLALHAGNVIVGTVGSSQKKEYTVIGDVVNVAFRIEALNRNFGSRMLISDSVAKATGATGLESLPPISVKGRDEPVALFRVI